MVNLLQLRGWDVTRVTNTATFLSS